MRLARPAPEDQVVRALVDQHPQRVIDRRAGDVRARQPDVPAAVADEQREAQLRGDERDRPHGARRIVPRERAQLGMRGEQLASAAGVRFAVEDADVIESGHRLR